MTYPLKILLIFFLVFITSILAEKDRMIISGDIFSNDGRTIPYVNISTELGESSTSDRDGRFILSIDNNQTKEVIFQHSAFESDTLDISTLMEENVTISLVQKSYLLSPIIIYGNLYGKESLQLPVEHRALDFNLISSSGVSLGEKVDRFGIQVRDYGGPAGLKTVSSPTGYSEHILITFDGLNLNSPQNGVFDMSSLPADFFSHGEFYSGQASSLYGSHAVGGTLNLMPAKPRNFITIRSGSLGDRGASAEYTLGLGETDFSIYGNKFQSDGNFRENNSFFQESGGAKLQLKNLAGWKISGIMMSTKAERGIPGSIGYPSLEAWKKNHDSFYLFSARTVSKWGQTELTSGFIDSDENYRDPAWDIDSNHRIKNLQNRFIHRVEKDKYLRNTISLELRQTKVNSDDAGNHSMVGAASGFLSQITINEKFVFSPSLRFDWNNYSKKNIATGNLALLYSFPIKPIESLTISSGTSYRSPTFNDLFWEDPLGYTIGNPDLKSEQGISTNLKINFQPLIDIVYFSAKAGKYHTDNLIQWTPNEAWVYSPQNVSKSESIIMGIITSIKPKKFPIQFTLGIEKTDSQILSNSINKGKRLLYVPPTSQWAEIQFIIGKTIYDLSFRNLGPSRYSYDDDAFMGKYRRLDLSINHSSKLNGYIMTFEAGARNLLNNKDLQSIYNYPEPGRTLFLVLSIGL